VLRLRTAAGPSAGSTIEMSRPRIRQRDLVLAECAPVAAPSRAGAIHMQTTESARLGSGPARRGSSRVAPPRAAAARAPMSPTRCELRGCSHEQSTGAQCRRPNRASGSLVAHASRPATPVARRGCVVGGAGSSRGRLCARRSSSSTCSVQRDEAIVLARDCVPRARHSARAVLTSATSLRLRSFRSPSSLPMVCPIARPASDCSYLIARSDCTSTTSFPSSVSPPGRSCATRCPFPPATAEQSVV
jgi:hypothetical protein